MRNKLLYITLISSLLLVACSNNIDLTENKRIEISFRVNDFTEKGQRANNTKNPGSDAEQTVNNLYLFLFDTAGANPERYFVDAATFTGGTWDINNNKIILDLVQVQAGIRQVYIVANINTDIKTALDNVTNVAGLQSVFKTTAQPWSTNITSPFLMTGYSSNHDFNLNNVLDNVPLIRTIAKVELNIKLSDKFQSAPEMAGTNLNNFKYRYVDFDKRTYVIKPNTKPDDLANSAANVWPQITDWSPWAATLNANPVPDAGTGYTLANNKVTELRIITYLNERDNIGAAIEIAIPPIDDGDLPPPEFGPELYRLPLPDKILRNHWYQYEVEI